MTNRKAVNPIVAHVRGLDGEYYLLSEVAEQLGITVNALRALARRFPDELGPYGVTYLGQTKIFVFWPEDIDALRRYLATPRDLAKGRGRPPLWSHAEQRERHSRHRMAYHWGQRADYLASVGRDAEALQARQRAEALHGQLKREYIARLKRHVESRDPRPA
jgi:hypothetical protein